MTHLPVDSQRTPNPSGRLANWLALLALLAVGIVWPVAGAASPIGAYVGSLLLSGVR